MSEATTVTEPVIDFRSPVRAASAPVPTPDAAARAHDPGLLSPEPSPDALQRGRLP